MKNRNEARKAAYRYWRDQGYNSKQSKKLSGNLTKTYNSAAQKKYDLPKEFKPKVKSTADARKMAYLNVPAKVRREWNKERKSERKKKIDNMEKYWKAVEKASGKNKKRLMKKIEKLLNEAANSREFYKTLQEQYKQVVGIALVKQETPTY